MRRRSLLPSLLAGPPLSPMGRDPFLQLRHEMDRLFDEAVRGNGTSETLSGGSVMAPRMDVSETDNEIRICAELPGVGQDDVDVNVTNDVLTISGQKKIERDEQKENFYVAERSVGGFARSVRLPFAVDPGQVHATFENGVLHVAVPKPQEQNRSGRVQIKAGGANTAQQSLGAGASGQNLEQAAEAMRSANAPAQGSTQAQPQGTGEPSAREKHETT